MLDIGDRKLVFNAMAPIFPLWPLFVMLQHPMDTLYCVSACVEQARTGQGGCKLVTYFS